MSEKLIFESIYLEVAEERDELKARIAQLEAALREVKIALASDDIEYDDLRAVDQIIHQAFKELK